MCSALVGVSITNELCDWDRGTRGLQHANNEPDTFDYENIEAHTRPSAATGPAPTNRRAAAMGSRANANFMMSKGLKS